VARDEDDVIGGCNGGHDQGKGKQELAEKAHGVSIAGCAA
jgi:hypothetical protein